jgi:hypothetical protein
MSSGSPLFDSPAAGSFHCAPDHFCLGSSSSIVSPGLSGTTGATAGLSASPTPLGGSSAAPRSLAGAVTLPMSPVSAGAGLGFAPWLVVGVLPAAGVCLAAALLFGAGFRLCALLSPARPDEQSSAMQAIVSSAIEVLAAGRRTAGSKEVRLNSDTIARRWPCRGIALSGFPAAPPLWLATACSFRCAKRTRTKRTTRRVWPAGGGPVGG